MEKVWTKEDNEFKIRQVFSSISNYSASYLIICNWIITYQYILYNPFLSRASLFIIMYPIWFKKINAHRNYYRCTHKYDQGCPAIKQVQRIQEDPPLYRATYYGHHNCKSTFNQEIILEPDTFSGSSMFLSFNNSIPSQEHPFSSPVFESTKRKEPVEVIHDDHIAHNQLSSSDYLLLCDYERFRLF